ncbi:hypothetical protein E1301_Tti005786 [Triplophysa tibetana]|uniref:Uncharacterized protein n=1 Tax=Triplophysa tibetana TaxID=1572043 RepID=A0A5A9NGE1_9TELE|nr:hypothetical protein E1301_Tti005786 [Triplophysa tibetana]
MPFPQRSVEPQLVSRLRVSLASEKTFITPDGRRVRKPVLSNSLEEMDSLRSQQPVLPECDLIHLIRLQLTSRPIKPLLGKLYYITIMAVLRLAFSLAPSLGITVVSAAGESGGMFGVNQPVQGCGSSGSIALLGPPA